MTARRSQSGISLISLMIGLILSMLVVMTMLSVYRGTVRITVDATQGAQLGGQLSTGLLAAQMRLQSAGFRIDDPAYAQDIVIVADARLDSGVLLGTAQPGLPASGNAVLWREEDRCRGLLFIDRGLYYLSATGACADAADTVGTLAWPNVTQLIGEAAGDNRIGMQIGATEGECNPFGVTTSTGRISVTLNVFYLNALDSFDASRPLTPATVCLPNFPPASSPA